MVDVVGGGFTSGTGGSNIVPDLETKDTKSRVSESLIEGGTGHKGFTEGLTEPKERSEARGGELPHETGEPFVDYEPGLTLSQQKMLTEFEGGQGTEAVTLVSHQGNDPVSPERQAEIDKWYTDNVEKPWWGNQGNFVEAIKGESSLGSLNPGEQEVLLANASNNRISRASEEIMATSVETRETVAGVMMERSVALMQRDNPNEMSAGLLAVKALRLAPNSAELISGLSVEESGVVAKAIGPLMQRMLPGTFEPNPLMQAVESTLDNLASRPMNEAGQAFVGQLFANTDSIVYEYHTTLAESMGPALASTWYPNDAAKQKSEGKRLTGILQTEQGRSLISDTDVHGLARLQALEVIQANPEITGEVLKAHRGSGWDNPVLTKAMAQPMAEQYMQLRGDQSLSLAGTHLDNTVGFAMSAKPLIPENATPEEIAALEEKFAEGRHSYFTGNEDVEKVTDRIRAVGGDDFKVAILPVQFTSPETGAVTLPLFRVERADGSIRYVDNVGRSYDSFSKWKKDNQLPPGTMVFPENGHLTRGANGEVRLGSAATPKTPDTFGEHLVGVLDKAALVGGIVAGGFVIFGSGGLAAPLVLGAAGLYQAGRAGEGLYDRYAHGQSLDLSDPQARQLWFEFGASALGSLAVGNLARIGMSGKALTPLGATVATGLNISAGVADTAAIANTGYELLTNWNNLKPGQRAQMGLSMAFWGVQQGAALRMSGARSFSDAVNMTFNPAFMRNQLLTSFAPPVIRDSSLPGSQVRIEYTVTNGLVDGDIRIIAGEGATQQDIDIHIQTAQTMLRHSGLEGRMRGMFTDGAPVGSERWRLNFEVNKLGSVIEAHTARLENPNLSNVQRTQIEADIRSYQEQLDNFNVRLAQMEADPQRGFGQVDAESAGGIRAEELGLPEQPVSPERLKALGLDEDAGYHWHLPSGSDTPVIRSHKEGQDRLAWDSHAGQAVRVGDDPVRPTFVNDSPGTHAVSESFDIGQAIKTRDAAIAERDVLLAQREENGTLSDADASKLSRARGTINEQSRLIGEAGAVDYIQTTYPNAVLEYGGPNQASQAGDFDQIWRIPGTDGAGDQFILVESKGGTASLGTRTIGTDVHTQGTPEYFAEISRIMGNSSDPAIRSLMRDIRLARQRGDVRYLEVKTPIVDGAVVSVKHREFDIAAR